MALSKQLAPVTNLKAFTAWATKKGLKVSEGLPFGTPRKGAHDPRSWHYDTQTTGGQVWSLAFDINDPRGGAVEAAALKTAVKVAQSMGLSVIYARDGAQGSAAFHKTHLHVDVGSVSNLGRGAFKTLPGDLVVWNIQPHLKDARTNLWDADFDKRMTAVRSASRYGGQKFPWGVAYTQQVIGTTADGVWGPKSRRAHDQAVAAIQRQLGVTPDGIWGPKTEAAYKAARKKYKK